MIRDLPKIPILAFKKVTNSLYFLPASLTVASILAACLLLFLDHNWTTQALNRLWWSDVDSAREFLSTSASVMITIVSVSFSVVVVALTLASNQFCPRVLGRFIEDRVNRLTFGILIGNFAFALVALSVLDSAEKAPGLACTGCFLYDLASTAMFIYFIHHIASSLQVDAIISDTLDKTLVQIRRVKSEEYTMLGPADSSPPVREGLCPVKKIGYVQAIHVSDLLSISEELGRPLHLAIGLGDFVTPESQCVKDSPSELTEDTAIRIGECFDVGYSRILESDVSFGFREIVDIALKAISPAVNDPTTAVTCIHNLTALFQELGRDKWPSAVLGSSTDGPGLIFPGNSPQDYLNLTIDQLIHFAAESPRVAEALLGFLERVVWISESEEWRSALREKGDEILRLTSVTIKSELWLRRLKTRYESLAQRLS